MKMRSLERAFPSQVINANLVLCIFKSSFRLFSKKGCPKRFAIHCNISTKFLFQGFSVLEFQAAVIMKLVGLIDEVSAVQQYFSYHGSLNFSLLHFPPTGYTFTFTAALNSAREL